MAKRSKQKPITTLAEAEAWCRRHEVQMGWCADCPKAKQWYACGPDDDAEAATPWAAVEKLRRKMEKAK